MAEEIKEWKAGKKKLKSTILDEAGGRTVFLATGPELDERARRAKAIKNIRVGLKLSQPKMAKALRVGIAALRNWEYGRRKVPESMLLLAELLRDLPAVRRRLLDHSA